MRCKQLSIWRPWSYAVLLVAGAVGLLLALAGVVVAASPIVLDGLFGDWAGHPNVPDPQGDAVTAADLVAFFFDTNPNEETAYFMAERIS
ncbi:MAG: hypothetical protein Q9O62_08215, partial [Ardenticatenia bacterium]|nr:hypothetical protein [Ardenticatenia bacterium]